MHLAKFHVRFPMLLYITDGAQGHYHVSN